MATKHLRESYLDEAKRDALIKEVERDRKRLNDSVAALRRLGFVVDDADQLQAINRQWLREFLTSEYQRFIGAGFIPEALRTQTLKQYNQVGAEAEPYVITIEQVFKARQFPLKIDSKGHFWFDEKAVKAWATEQATLHFTEAQRKYYTLIGQLFDKLNEVTEFEQTHCSRTFAACGRTAVTIDGRVYHVGVSSYFGDRDKAGSPTGKMTLNAGRYLEFIRYENLFQ